MISITKYSNIHFNQLVTFLKKNWAHTHTLYDKNLFDWQYRINGRIESLIVFDDKTIVGFLGNIPGAYFVKGKVIEGIGFTMWVVDESYRNAGLGVLLVREAEKGNKVSLILGANKKAELLYIRMGYSVLTNLNRYVLPLNTDGYVKLLLKDYDRRKIFEWCESIVKYDMKTVTPQRTIDPVRLEKLFIKSISDVIDFSFFRDCRFWEWRYINSPGYRYYFFGNPDDEGIIVSRIERVISKENLNIDGIRVLRIIEIIPANPDTWKGFVDKNIVSLIKRMLLWAKESGCVAADFQCSTKRLEKMLFKVGFKKQFGDYMPHNCSLTRLFQPFKHKVEPINFVWKIRDDCGKPIKIDVNKSYFVKSDCDMDRPNVWPLPANWR